MAFTMAGTRGRVRMRHLPRKVKGPSGYRGETERRESVKVTRTHTKLYDEPQKGLFSKVANVAKNLFRRGAK